MLGNLIRELLGIDNGVASAPASKKGMLPKELPMKPKEQKRLYKTNGGGYSQFYDNPTFAGSLNPKQEDGYDTTVKYLRGNIQFPGRTNYGVPQDNMIDTSMGYLTNDQFNQGATGRLQRQSNPMDMDTIPGNYTFPGRTGYFQGSNPFGNQPERNNYQNINPFNQDNTLRGNQIQSPSLDRYFNRY